MCDPSPLLRYVRWFSSAGHSRALYSRPFPFLAIHLGRSSMEASRNVNASSTAQCDLFCTYFSIRLQNLKLRLLRFTPGRERLVPFPHTYLHKSNFTISERQSKWRLLDTQTSVHTTPIIIALTTRFGVEGSAHECPAFSRTFTKGVLQSIWSASHQTVPFFSTFNHVGHSRRLCKPHNGSLQSPRAAVPTPPPAFKTKHPPCLSREGFTLPSLLSGFRFCQRA
ncbi:hypothetical protein AVEN_84436-1 [Araneus ventricosus]|uniref:Uncharacterized protein n=1 Tax=Araneus ventricosus TaxID=182803 RepID=A0A4Y2VLE3_ARAVE|nr:hypothetical protein AVEN_84436-1 [Araneus ventricosus]